jgi:hypothetical protein
MVDKIGGIDAAADRSRRGFDLLAETVTDFNYCDQVILVLETSSWQ